MKIRTPLDDQREPKPPPQLFLWAKILALFAVFDVSGLAELSLVIVPASTGNDDKKLDCCH